MKRTLSAGGVVVNRRGEVLVVNQHGNSWSLPKGHLDPGEDALTAAKREILEESGVSYLALIEDLGRYERHRIGLNGGDDPKEIKTIDMFLFTTSQMELRPLDPDHPEARWVELDQVAGLLTHPKDQIFFAGVLERVKKLASP